MKRGHGRGTNLIPHRPIRKTTRVTISRDHIRSRRIVRTCATIPTKATPLAIQPFTGAGSGILAIYRALGDQFNVATTYYYLAQLAREQRDEAAAREANEEALALFRQLGHEAGIAQCLAWALVDA